MDFLNIRSKLAIKLGLMVVFIALAGGGWTVLAQMSVTAATLSGRVATAKGAAVSGATITITYRAKNQAWSTTSDEQGLYRFLYLPPGAYELKVERSGFMTARRLLTLSASQAMDVPIMVAIASLTEKVDVTADGPVVEVARTQVSETIRPSEMDFLPLNGRNYLDLALLAPGVSRTNTGSAQRFAETSAVPGTGLSMAGQRNLNNSFIVDGLSANDDAADLAGTFYGQEIIREFQVVTSGGIAEYGRASGGIVNISTQSGTNDWRARLYGFLRNQRLDARNPLATRPDPLTQTQYGASVGGPVKRDRTFWFSNFEQTRQRRAGFITIAPADIAAIYRALDPVDYKRPRLQTGEFPTGLDATNYFMRIDHRPSDAHLLAARYSLYDISSPNARNVGGLNDLSRGAALDNRDQTLALNAVTILSPKTINEARVQFTRSRLAAPVNDPLGPAVNIAGVANFGAATFSPTARTMNHWNLVDTISTQKGSHLLKAGGDVLYNRVNITFPGPQPGVYSFASLTDFQSEPRRYLTFQQAFGESRQFQSNPNLGLFIQEAWRPHPHLTINAGLRYDLQWLPAPIRTDTTNLAPRIGIALSPNDHKTVVRASFGLFYDRIPLRATSNALQRDGRKYKVAVLPFGQPDAPVFPNVLPSFPPGLLTSITTIDPYIKHGYSEQASLQLERELSPTTSLSIAYQHLRGLHILMSRNLNVPTLPVDEAARQGISNLGRPDPRFANINRYESSGDSYYNGMTISLHKRAAHWVGFWLSYTFSKAIDDAGNFFFSTPQNNFDLRGDRGLSDNDQRRRLAISGWLKAPTAGHDSSLRRRLAGFQLSYIFTYESALPFNIQTGADRNHDTNVNDRPEGVGRNTGRGFNFASLDLRISRMFRVTERAKLETMVEAFNGLNRTNRQLPNNIFGPGATPRPSFGRATAAADPRQIQFGLRLNF
ncbi:MAG: TonB-dependent receptor [Acidobacteria bacterium]|nr:TonB-dependent receptor [Acidobacteriota bacterium]